jgi:hypothetical protein
LRTGFSMILTVSAGASSALASVFFLPSLSGWPTLQLSR